MTFNQTDNGWQIVNNSPTSVTSASVKMNDNEQLALLTLDERVQEFSSANIDFPAHTISNIKLDYQMFGFNSEYVIGRNDAVNQCLEYVNVNVDCYSLAVELYHFDKLTDHCPLSAAMLFLYQFIRYKVLFS